MGCIASLLDQAATLGLELTVAGDALRMIVPKTLNAQSLAEQLTANKTAVIAYLNGEPPMKDSDSGSLCEPKLDLGYDAFPVDSLPDVMANFVREASVAIHCDSALVALPVLAVVSTAIGNSRRVRLKNKWVEPAVVWAAIVCGSGSRKSPAAELPMRYADEWERAERKWYETDLIKHETDIQKHSIALAEWKKKPQGDPPAKPEPPRCKRFSVADVTAEALAVALDTNPRGLLLYRDELSGFFGGLGRYQSGSSRADESMYLSMFSARRVVVDRLSRESINVPNAFLSIVGGITPGVLASVLTPERFASGLAARFLLAMPPRRVNQWTEEDLSESVDSRFDQMFQRLLSLDMGAAGSIQTLFLSSDAKQAFIEFHDEFEQKSFEIESDDVCAARSKLTGYAARLALIFALAQWADGFDDESPQLVGEDMMLRSITLVRWFAREAARVYACLFELSDAAEMDAVVEILRGHGGTASIRDLMRGPGRRRWDSADDVETDLAKLRKANLGQWNVGRKQRTFSLNGKQSRLK